MAIGLKQQEDQKTPEQARKELLSIIMDSPEVFFSLLNDYIHEVCNQNNAIRQHIHSGTGEVYVKDHRLDYAQPHADISRPIQEIRHLVHLAQRNHMQLGTTAEANMRMPEAVPTQPEV
jgi:hypothetical protein